MRVAGPPVWAALLVVATVGPPRAAAVSPPAVLRVAGETSPLGWPYSSFAEATVDAGGRLVFVASSTAVFGRVGDALAQRIGAGVVLPDGRRVAGVGAPALAADGCVLSRATFSSGGEAVVRGCGATFTSVIDAGIAAPGGGTIRALDPAVSVAGSDVIAATATLEDGTSVVLRRDAGGLVELARSGAPAPSGGSYAAFRLLGVSGGGEVAFRAAVSEGPDGLFVAGDGGTLTVAAVGQGSPAGGSFTAIGGGHLHPGGRLVFRATLSTSRSGLFTADVNDPLLLLQPRLLDGVDLPIAGATLQGFPGSTDPVIDQEGTIAFRALLDGPGDTPPSGVFTLTTAGTIATVATVRGEVPGVGTVTRLRDPVLADDGSVVVSLVVAGRGPGLFVARDGVLAPLARLGDATDVDTGDARFRFGPATATTAAEGAVFLGERSAIFRAATDGAVAALAYTGRPGPLGGVIATLGPPVVDGRGGVYFGAEFRGATGGNEALLAAGDGALEVLVSPARRLLGGGGIRELFPTSVDALARPAGATSGVAFTAALRGAKASEAVFLARSRTRVKALVRTGQRAGGQRLANLGTPAMGPRDRTALLVQVGRDRRRDAIVTMAGAPAIVAVEGSATRARGGGRFADLGPPVVGRMGTVFRAVLDTPAAEGIFVGRGRRLGLVVGAGDTATTGARLRSFDDPVIVGDEVWFLARAAGSVAPAGLYRVTVAKPPRKSDAPLPVEPVLLPGDPAPAPLGGVVVRMDAPRVGPSNTVSLVVGVGGGAATTAIVQFLPTLP
jgi:hypothetical protein